MKSLRATQHELSVPLVQLQILDETSRRLPSFREKLEKCNLFPLRPTGIEILQINLGKMCNQTCAHCHVDAGPDRREIMTQATMRECLDAIKRFHIPVVDLTGGAPEMNPHFSWFAERVSKLGSRLIVRSNLTILTVNEKYRRLPQFFADHEATLVSSLPCYTEENTDKQRGAGVFSRSIEALRMLNEVGYGQEGAGLELNLVYNPLGPYLPPPQEILQSDYRRMLLENHRVLFNELYCITNMPISRFLDDLLISGKYEEYMTTLVDSFNPASAHGVMCRNTLSVGWDGALYDCDFNQMLEIELSPGSPRHISDFDVDRLNSREIAVNQHCFGCAAGAGSSCTGEISK